MCRWRLERGEVRSGFSWDSLRRGVCHPCGSSCSGGASFVLCGWICTQAVRQLKDPDPSSVILDEVWGMAAIFWMLPRVASSWVFVLWAFLLFRAFDVLKPFPLRRLERLPEGWGVVADGLGASLYAILILKVSWVIFDFRFSILDYVESNPKSKIQNLK